MANYDSEQYWRIDGIVANDNTATPPNRTIGDTADFTFQFAQLRGESQDEYHDRIRNLEERGKTAGSASSSVSINGNPSYNPGSGDSPLVAIRSPESEPIDYSCWGLLENFDTTSPDKDHDRAYRVKITYLADYDEYEDKQAVESDLGRRGFH